MARKLTLEIVKERLKEINPNIEILSDEYINSKTHLKCRCLIDGHEWDIKWGKLQSGRGCPKCAIETRKSKLKLSIGEVRDRVRKISPNIEILSDEYANAHSHLNCMCSVDGYKWSTTWATLSQGHGCPLCAGSILPSLSEIKSYLYETNPDIEVLNKKYTSSSQKIKCRCLIDGHEWGTVWGHLKRGTGCPECGIKKTKEKQKFSTDYVFSKISDIHPDITILSRDYVNSIGALSCQCNIDGHIWESNFSRLQQGHGCPKCAGKLKLTLKEVKKKLREMNPNIEITSGEYTNNNTSMRLKCNVDGHEWNAVWGSLSQGSGCPMCGGTTKLTIEEIIERLGTINPNIEILSGEYVNSSTPLTCKCLIDGHHIWRATWSNLSRGTGCPRCSMSKGEYQILKYLSLNSVLYKDEFIFEDCRHIRPLPFDFAIEGSNNNITGIIEYDGKQHFEPVDFAGKGDTWAKEQYENNVKKDNIKNKYCEDNNIPLLRIPYWEFDNIEEILHSWLVTYGLIEDNLKDVI